jgi:phage repressor protein C with HTH and peptisase S24 domain
MDGTPLPSIRISEKLHKKLQNAVKHSGLPVADVRRLALTLGLDALSRMNYDVDQFLCDNVAKLEQEQAATQAAQNVLAFPEIPLLHAAAGSPATSDAETFAPLRDYGPGRIACQLHGDSMAPKYPDGSTVILRERGSLKKPLLKNGEIYLFDVAGEKTLKIYQSRPATNQEIEQGITYVSKSDGAPKVRTLRSINPAFPEIVINGDSDWLAWLDKDDN